ncbi:MAG: CPBP family intramembrane metalloprotease [Acidobacteriia bacterium]|nr:CPBP family intramembrane metalloprotease [Terriglobia bacterium]
MTDDGTPGNLPPAAEPLGEAAPVFAPPPAPTPEPWTVRDLLLFIALLPIAFVAAYFLVMIGYTLLAPLARWPSLTPKIAGGTLFLLVVQTVLYFFVLGLVYLLVAVRYQLPFWSGVGWRMPRSWHVPAYFLAGLVLAFAVLLAPPLLPDTESFPLQEMFTSRAASYAIGAFAITVAPFMEELIFRGVMFAVFERRAGLRFAVLATAVLFAGLHVPEYWRAWNHVLMILVVGVAFSLARGITGSLAPSVILHMGYNASMMMGLFFSTQQFRNLHTLFLK